MTSKQGSTFRLKVHLPAAVDRELFFARCWDELSSAGLLGVHEGTVLSNDAATAGLETESWTLDAAEAPRERDWIGSQAEADAELYFASASEAETARAQVIAWAVKRASRSRSNCPRTGTPIGKNPSGASSCPRTGK